MSKTIDHSQRAHALLSASSAHRWLNCPPSAVAQELYPSDAGVSPYALEGTQAHEVAEIIARMRVLGETRDLPDYATKEMIDHAEAYADYIQEQITDPNALILLEQRVDFSPWVKDGFGTADCIIIQNKRMDIIDYKYGKGVVVSAEGNSQEMLYGLGALNDYGFAYDIEEVYLHIFQPRLRNISKDWWNVAGLLEWGESLVKPTAVLAAKGEGDYAAGEWCQFCKHAGLCRELRDKCVRYVKHQDVDISVPTLTPWEVAEALRTEPLITLWLKRVKETALADMLKGEHIPGYKVVCGKPGNRKWKNELDAVAELNASGYSEEDYITSKLKSVAELEKSIGRKAVAEMVGHLIERAPGSPAIAPETDKRPGYTPADNFKNLEE